VVPEFGPKPRALPTCGILRSETIFLRPRNHPEAEAPWAHDTSATPANVLWRWDDVMASSALKSALR
jgi:hypothetical protein